MNDLKMSPLVPPRRRVFADGSNQPSCGQASVARALDCGAALRRSTARLLEELDDVTEIHGIPTSNMPDDDSMVTTLTSARSACRNPDRG